METYSFPNIAARVPKISGRGSAVRPILDDKGQCGGFRSLIAHGGTGSAALAIGGAGTLTWAISEKAPALRFIAQPDGGDAFITVTSIKVDNDELVTGSVPVKLFAPDSVFNPMVGKWFDTSSKVTASFQNDGAAAQKVFAAFTA